MVGDRLGKTESTITLKIATLVSIVGGFMTIIGVLIGLLISTLSAQPVRELVAQHEKEIGRNKEDIAQNRNDIKDMIKQINEIHLVVVENKKPKGE